MTMPPLTEEMRRFIAAIPSVPHLEAILLLRTEPGKAWEAGPLARRLFIDGERAGQILDYLVRAGIAASCAPRSPGHAYRPVSPELDALVGRVSDYYSRRLVEVTKLIHANSGASQTQRAQQFADAFRWRKEC